MTEKSVVSQVSVTGKKTRKVVLPTMNGNALDANNPNILKSRINADSILKGRNQNFTEDELYDFVYGACLEYAGGLSMALNARNVPHDFGAVIAPDENNNSVVAHVAVKIGDKYFDAEGVHEKINLRASWAARAPGSYDVEIWIQPDLGAVKRLAKKLGCEFESDSKEGAEYVRDKLLKLRASPTFAIEKLTPDFWQDRTGRYHIGRLEEAGGERFGASVVHEENTRPLTSFRREQTCLMEQFERDQDVG